MRTLLALIKKEFLQIKRNKLMIKIIIAMPVMQLIVLVNAANFDIKNISMSIVDKDNSTLSMKLISKLQSSGYFILEDFNNSTDVAMDNLASDKTDILLEIPSKFEQDVYRGDNPRLSITVNAINGMKSSIASSYISNIISDFGMAQAVNIKEMKPQKEIEVTYSQWFNPKLDSKSLMVPGVLAVIITLVGVLLSALNIVREKEMGTIEQLNVTPINKIEFIIGKLFPFLVIGLCQLTLGLIVAVVVFKLQIVGSLWLLYGIIVIYLVTVLGLGFLISTISQTQSQAMMVTLFFSMIFILMSGLFTPTDSMPQWAKMLNMINPTAYLVEIIRLVILKGSTFIDIIKPLTGIVVLGVCINSIVLWRYRKVS